jgi:hypothetical protein
MHAAGVTGLCLVLGGCVFVNVEEDKNPGAVVYHGTETLEYAWAVANPDKRDCLLTWKVLGHRSSREGGCPNCEWVLDMELIYKKLDSEDNGTCEDLGLKEDLTWTYGYNPDHYGAEAILLYDPEEEKWITWLTENKSSDVIEWDEDEGIFSYSGGFHSVENTGEDPDYDEYLRDYFSSYWVGSGEFDF